MIKKYFALSLIAASVAVAGCSDDDDDDIDNGGEPTTPVVELPVATPGEGGSVYDTIVNTDTLSSLRAAIDAAGLADALDDESAEYTVFAPDNAAFEALNTEESPTALADLMADPDALTRVLQYHVITGSVDAEALGAAVAIATEEAPATYATLIEGESVTVDVSATANTGLAVNGSDISATDMMPEVAEGETTSGLVHTIVDVLEAPEATVVPPVEGEPGEPVEPGEGETPTTPPTDGGGAIQSTLEADGNYSTFLGLGFLDSYEANAWTVFAPTDEAITAAGTTPNVQDLIAVNAGPKTAAELVADGSIVTNQGKEYTVTGDETALLVDGKAATLIATSASGTLVYSLDGILE